MSVSTGSNHCSVNSKNKVVELSATWTIENAHFQLNPFPDLLESPPMYLNDRTQTWYICISRERYGIKVSMKVVCADDVRGEYEIWIINEDGEKITLTERQILNCSYKTISMTASDFQSKWIIDDRIVLYGEMKVITLPKNGETSNTSKAQLIPPDVYLNKLSLLEDQKFTDVILVCGKDKFKVHKAILVAHSSVFRAMFNSDMKESSTNRVEIDDLDYEVVEQMLHFIYTDKAPKVHLMADRLLGAADKYDLVGLKIVCEQALCEQLSVENALQMLAFANRHNTKLLASQAKTFLAKNIEEAMLTKDWLDLVAKLSVQNEEN
ncbi:speckle-type POZ protein [Aedes albopictus]|uniref:BTB domain-containing protein n=1 Tax=Aedes albopictus TaxID=7160 RepID=A0ABM2A6Z8_AEDAL